jgi:hypothetical protein
MVSHSSATDTVTQIQALPPRTPAGACEIEAWWRYNERGHTSRGQMRAKLSFPVPVGRCEASRVGRSRIGLLSLSEYEPEMALR